MSKLAKMLEYAYAGNTERSRIANTESFKKTVLDTIPKSQKELLLSDGMQSTTLLQEEVYNTIIEGSQPVQVVRNIFPIINTNTNQVRVTYEDGALGKAVDVAEGAAIPINTENFSTHDITIKKIGTRPVITNELIEDGLWDMVEFSLRRAGQKLEHKFNYDVINEAVDSTTYSTMNSVTSTTCTPVKLIEMIKEIHNDDYIPTDLILTPTAESQLISGNNLLQANYAGDSKALRNYDIGTLFGLKMHRLTIDGGGQTMLWNNGYNASNEIGALICDPSYCMIAMRRDITVEQYDDPIHDLVGIAATMRYGVKTITPQKAAYLKHS
jgi:hypothetical protein